MTRVVEGKLDGSGRRFGIVVSRFHNMVTERLLEGALDCLTRHAADKEKIDIVRVPGAYEIPFAARKLAGTNRYDAVLCLGAVIRGSTPHFDYIAAEVSRGIGQAGVHSPVPVVFGVLTTDTLDQAMERAGGKMGNKGWEAALAALETANIPFQELE